MSADLIAELKAAEADVAAKAITANAAGDALLAAHTRLRIARERYETAFSEALHENGSESFEALGRKIDLRLRPTGPLDSPIEPTGGTR